MISKVTNVTVTLVFLIPPHSPLKLKFRIKIKTLRKNLNLKNINCGVSQENNKKRKN
jgi:hypothetical protein